MFSFLFKYLDYFQKSSFGEWIVDTKHKGTRDDPKDFPYVSYDDIVLQFIEEINEFASNNDMTDYHSVQGLSLDSDLTDEQLFYKLLEIVRIERFCDGLLLSKLENGTIVNIIKRIKQKYDLLLGDKNYEK
ncbi:MAG TPA: hypothetical protein GXZ48_04550 [Acholeplasmataceae bacterium]|nr:hypothetical protein [Acholeplasmataceae bacterium]